LAALALALLALGGGLLGDLDRLQALALVAFEGIVRFARGNGGDSCLQARCWDPLYLARIGPRVTGRHAQMQVAMR